MTALFGISYRDKWKTSPIDVTSGWKSALGVLGLASTSFFWPSGWPLLSFGAISLRSINALRTTKAILQAKNGSAASPQHTQSTFPSFSQHQKRFSVPLVPVRSAKKSRPCCQNLMNRHKFFFTTRTRKYII